MITLSINGVDVQAEEGMTIYQAAEKAGIYIPVLCYHPDLSIFGACRVCMVEANARVVTACRAPVEEGMVVKTDTEDVDLIRKLNTELILANHSGDCQICARNGNCQLQEVCSFIGINPERMQRLRRFDASQYSVDTSNPYFERDPSKCVLCGICIRACDEINGVGAIDFAFRGYSTAVSTLGDKPLLESRCESCGECLVRCPSGALSPKKQEVPEREVKSVCTYCGVGCSLFLGVRGERVVSVRGDEESPVNEGDLCVKGRFGFGFIDHPERLKTPLIKKDGSFTEASWEEALNLVAEKIREARENFGPESLAGLSSARCTNEDNYLFMKLFRTLGSNNVDHCARL